MEVHARRPWLLEWGAAPLLGCAGAAMLALPQDWPPAAGLLLAAAALGLVGAVYRARFRRLLLVGRRALVRRSLLAEAVHDLSGLSVISGVCDRSGRLVSVSLWCGGDPILSLRVAQWDEAQLHGLLRALAERAQQVQLGLPVRVFLQRLEGRGLDRSGMAQARVGEAPARRLAGVVRDH
jgi:hypothetical protein